MTELQLRLKWLRPVADVQVGQLVILHEDNLNPQHCKLARIVSAIRGLDSRFKDQ